MNKPFKIVTYVLLAVFSVVNITGAIAQTVSVLGEIRTTGSVSIGSSSGHWTAARPTYPLLENTAIKTEDGNASVSLRDGSRVDLSRDTVATISGSSADYRITLGQGVIAFNITPSSSLSVSTPTANISVNSKTDLLQKVGYEKATRVLGVISVTKKGTEVRNISGKILVSSSATGSKMLTTGESILVGQDSNYKVYKTQVVGGETAPAAAGTSSGTAIAQGAIILSYVGLNVVGYINQNKSNFLP